MSDPLPLSGDERLVLNEAIDRLAAAEAALGRVTNEERQWRRFLSSMPEAQQANVARILDGFAAALTDAGWVHRDDVARAPRSSCVQPEAMPHAALAAEYPPCNRACGPDEHVEGCHQRQFGA